MTEENPMSGHALYEIDKAAANIVYQRAFDAYCANMSNRYMLLGQIALDRAESAKDRAIGGVLVKPAAPICEVRETHGQRITLWFSTAGKCLSYHCESIAAPVEHPADLTAKTSDYRMPSKREAEWKERVAQAAIEARTKANEAAAAAIKHAPAGLLIG